MDATLQRHAVAPTFPSTAIQQSSSVSCFSTSARVNLLPFFGSVFGFDCHRHRHYHRQCQRQRQCQVSVTRPGEAMQPCNRPSLAIHPMSDTEGYRITSITSYATCSTTSENQRNELLCTLSTNGYWARAFFGLVGSNVQ